MRSALPLFLAGCALSLAATPRAEAQPFSKEINTWKAQDATSPPPAGSLVFVGSSSIRRWEDLARDFADYDVIQRGFGGSMFSDLLPSTGPIVTAYDPSAIVVFEGTNDVANGKSADVVVADYERFVGRVRQDTTAPIFYIGITPAPIRRDRWDVSSEINRRIGEIATNDASLTYIDAASPYLVNGEPPQVDASSDFLGDNLHLTRSGYDKFRDAIRPAVTGVVAAPAFVANADTLRPGESLLLDLGPDDGTNGRHTAGTDANGNRWNNWQPVNGNVEILAGERKNDLLASDGRATGIDLVVTGGLKANGRNNGGLLSPSPALLGGFAVDTVTEDYFFGEGPDQPASLMLDGLDPDGLYELTLFGTRATGETRVTRYIVSGAREDSQTLQTSGPGAGTGSNGNNDTLVGFPAVQPDANGKLFIDLEIERGSFSYLGGLRLTAVPEPGSLGLFGLGLLAGLRRRR